VIKLNFRDISKIGSVDPLYHEVEELSLNHNHLKTLDGIQQFTKLQKLYLNFNEITDANEFLKVQKSLKVLECKSNP
jgi:Leucine-rich repeat (LRR) protein